MTKNAYIGNFRSIFLPLLTLLQASDHLIKATPSCKGGSKLQNEWSYIKIGQELASILKK